MATLRKRKGEMVYNVEGTSSPSLRNMHASRSIDAMERGASLNDTELTSSPASTSICVVSTEREPLMLESDTKDREDVKEKKILEKSSVTEAQL